MYTWREAIDPVSRRFGERGTIVKRMVERSDSRSKTRAVSRDTKTGWKSGSAGIGTVSSGHDPGVCAWRCKLACKRPNYSNVGGRKWFCVTVATTTGAFAESSADGIAATFHYPTAINWRRYRGQFPPNTFKTWPRQRNPTPLFPNSIRSFFRNVPNFNFPSGLVSSRTRNFETTMSISKRLTNNFDRRTAEEGGRRIFVKTAVLATTRGIVLTFRAAPPNNQSLTRLVLSESSDVTADIANTNRPLLASCETVACRPRINLVKLPTRLARSRSLAPWIDKLPDPVFRRHVTLNVATSNTEEKCYGFTKCTRENQTNAPRLSLSLSQFYLPPLLFTLDSTNQRAKTNVSFLESTFHTTEIRSIRSFSIDSVSRRERNVAIIARTRI